MPGPCLPRWISLPARLSLRKKGKPSASATEEIGGDTRTSDEPVHGTVWKGKATAIVALGLAIAFGLWIWDRFEFNRWNDQFQTGTYFARTKQYQDAISYFNRAIRLEDLMMPGHTLAGVLPTTNWALVRGWQVRIKTAREPSWTSANTSEHWRIMPN